MIYGYDSRTLNNYGLKQMREISLAVAAHDLRELADFLKEAAQELEEASSYHWHRHAPDELRQRLGCDVIVASNKSEARK
jgi:hypothetical protein